MTHRLVYSSEPKAEVPNKKPLAKGPLKYRLEKQGRGGKLVTVLFNLPMTEAEARLLLQKLQSQFGVGGTYKDERIELRGDLTGKLTPEIVGQPLVKAGG